MSIDTPADDVVAQDVTEADRPRNEGIQTVAETLPKPPSHGFSGSFVLNDDDRHEDEIGIDVGYRNLPNGSLYQHARASWYAHEDQADGQSVVLSTSYNPDWSQEDQDVAVVLTSSRWRAGTGEGEDYTAFYKYDLKLRQLDADGEVRDETPAESLNLKIQPQLDGLVNGKGEPLQLPYGEGTLVNVQTTWIEEPDEALDRALDLVEHVFGYEDRPGDLNPESRRFWKAEAHHRFSVEREDDVVHTIRQSTDLLARHAAEVDETAEYDSNRWLEAKITTEDWTQLGFPNLEAPILLKVYYPESPEYAPYPLDQPKIEAALAGKKKERTDDGESVRRSFTWSEFDDVQAALREIVLSHLVWADVGAEDLVADDFSEGATAEPYTFAHPQGRRSWLREHYMSLVPEIYREATKTNTTVVYDILEVVRERGTVTYEELMDETGAAYRTVRQHVARLEALGGEDEPGLLKKVQDACTFIAFSSRALEDEADDALDEIMPDDSPADRHGRADDRRERRQRQREQELAQDDDQDADDRDADDAPSEPAEDARDQADDDREEIWRSFRDVQLDADQLGAALDREHLDAEHVEIRTDPYAWIAD